ncbi:Cytochrome c551 peroxidase [Hyphomicrobium sulfonivorans]|uniref:Cytochrome c551 peroxidase n=2 Tax=Hyphomicrobium sulfonivorans TaxID=121290 RepID=A0A109BB51_HYPSL|nr:Cytochrome c551 peroxidase [Hyphomicrobium sulfonivorans]
MPLIEVSKSGGLLRGWRRMGFAPPVLGMTAVAILASLFGYLLSGSVQSQTPGPPITTVEALGSELFGDVNLSLHRSQACTSCHSPNLAFTDPRMAPEVGGAVSLGGDAKSLGERNAPTVTYAAHMPEFHINAAGEPIGGFFLDGRAKTLAEQAGGPPLNPLEMGMPDKASVVERLKENPRYVAAFNALFAPGVLNDVEQGYSAMTAAIARFESTPEFSTFDSRYDRSLRGEVKLTDQEELGRVLFFSEQFTSCSECHKGNMFGGTEKELFSNFEFHNIGVPANAALTAATGRGPDLGLAANAHLAAADGKAASVPVSAHRGKFKVPTLRNVAVTAPYMHNGVFGDLRTVVLFYDKFNNRSAARQINPETGKPWGDPETPENISTDDLERGRAMDNRRIDAMVAFLKTLTDKRFEHLIAP